MDAVPIPKIMIDVCLCSKEKRGGNNNNNTDIPPPLNFSLPRFV